MACSACMVPAKLSPADDALLPHAFILVTKRYCSTFICMAYNGLYSQTVPVKLANRQMRPLYYLLPHAGLCSSTSVVPQLQRVTLESTFESTCMPTAQTVVPAKLASMMPLLPHASCLMPQAYNVEMLSLGSTCVACMPRQWCRQNWQGVRWSPYYLMPHAGLWPHAGLSGACSYKRKTCRAARYRMPSDSDKLRFREVGKKRQLRVTFPSGVSF